MWHVKIPTHTLRLEVGILSYKRSLHKRIKKNHSATYYVRCRSHNIQLTVNNVKQMQLTQFSNYLVLN
jgi:hypothetical protein